MTIFQPFIDFRYRSKLNLLQNPFPRNVPLIANFDVSGFQRQTGHFFLHN